MHIVCVELPIHTCSAGPSALPVICLGGCCGERMGNHGVCRGFKCRMCGELCSSLWDFDETKHILLGILVPQGHIVYYPPFVYGPPCVV